MAYAVAAFFMAGAVYSSRFSGEFKKEGNSMLQIESIKTNVAPADAAKMYGLSVQRNGMARCPFHNDTHPSMKLYDDHFYCFACGAHGDVIDLTAKLLGLNFKETVHRLAVDFGISPNDDPPAAVKPQRPHVSQFRRDELLCLSTLTEYERLLRFWKQEYAPSVPDGRMTSDIPLRREIYHRLKICAVKNVPHTIKNIEELLKFYDTGVDLTPQQDRIHLANGTLGVNGTFTPGKTEIVRTRLPISYNPDAPRPEIWLRFLHDLLHEDDIPTLQEYLGYCLIPSTKGQRMMVIKGSGGEGKSQIGVVLSAIFGGYMKDGSIGKVSENPFARADLEHQLLMVDDDMKMEALK